MANISVIVPVYKVEAFLGRCVDSILNQTYSDFELILVDDGSPDRCGQLCDAYAAQDNRIHVIHQENGGLSAARNAGIDWAVANSASQWLAFIDSDDWVKPDYLEQLWRAVTETGCKMSVCGFYRTDGTAESEPKEFSVEILSPEDFYCGDIHGGVTAVAWNKLYHKSLFENLRYPIGKLHEDEFTTYKMVYALDKLALVSAELYAYYQNPQGIMGAKWNPRRMHMLEAWEQQMGFAREKHHAALERKAIRHYVYGCYEQIQAAKMDPQYQSYLPQLKKKMRMALKLGRDSGVFPLCWEKIWAYEEAYPCKPLWWLLSKVKK